MLVRFGSSQTKPPTALVYIPHFTIRRNIISQNLLRMSSVVPTSMLIETQNIPLMIPILFGHSILWSRNKVKLALFVQSKKMQSIINKTSFRNTLLVKSILISITAKIFYSYDYFTVLVKIAYCIYSYSLKKYIYEIKKRKILSHINSL